MRYNYQLINELMSRARFVNRFRQYGLWDRYSELYPNEDLVYTVGKSDYTKDWLFAQVNRSGSNFSNFFRDLLFELLLSFISL